MPLHCPKCFASMRASRRRWYDVPVMLFLLRPFRCTHCFHRTWRFAWRGEQPPAGINGGKKASPPTR